MNIITYRYNNQIKERHVDEWFQRLFGRSEFISTRRRLMHAEKEPGTSLIVVAEPDIIFIYLRESLIFTTPASPRTN